MFQWCLTDSVIVVAIFCFNVPILVAYKEALLALREIGYVDFREGQKEAVARIISGEVEFCRRF